MVRSKLLAVLLLLALALACLAGCGGAAAPEGGVEPAVTDEPAADGGEAEEIRLGVLTVTAVAEEDFVPMVADKLAPPELGAPPREVVFFDTLSSMLLALQAGQINKLGVPTAVAEYIVAGNDALTLRSGPPLQHGLSMAVLEEDAELLAQLNDAIAALQADGTIDDLVAAHIDGASPAAEPAPAPLPVIEGADTIKVAVTGDLPPIDYITAAGEPAGFNIALLAALSEQAGVNIELVAVNAGARVMALTSGRADAVFWVRTMITPDGTIGVSDYAPPGVALTDHYYIHTSSVVMMK